MMPPPTPEMRPRPRMPMKSKRDRRSRRAARAPPRAPRTMAVISKKWKTVAERRALPGSGMGRAARWERCCMNPIGMARGEGRIHGSRPVYTREHLEE